MIQGDISLDEHGKSSSNLPSENSDNENIIDKPVDDNKEEVDEIIEEGISDKKKDDTIKRSVPPLSDEFDKEFSEVINEARNNGLNFLFADDIFNNITKNYKQSERLYGKKLISVLSGFSADSIKKNLNISEFRDQIKRNISDNIDKAKSKGLLTRNNEITIKADELTLIKKYLLELEDKLKLNDFGNRTSRRHDVSGIKDETLPFRNNRYRDLDIKSTVRKAVKRGKKEPEKNDFVAYNRLKKGGIEIILAIDSSSSMHGKKLELCKKAAILLAYKSIFENDKIGLIIFGKEIITSLKPSKRLKDILINIIKISPSSTTDIAKTIRESFSLFSRFDVKKHLIIISDLLPTFGENPFDDSIKTAFEAKNKNITISVVGIFIDKEGADLGRRIADITEGRFYIANKSNLNSILLKDYYSYKKSFL